MFSWETAIVLSEFPKQLIYVFKIVLCLSIHSLIHVPGHFFTLHIKMAILKFLMNMESSMLH